MAVSRKDPQLAYYRAKKAGILILAGAAGLAFVSIQNRIAERRVERVITAVSQYHDKTGKFPAQLEDIVPEFLPSIPRAKLSLMFVVTGRKR